MYTYKRQNDTVEFKFKSMYAAINGVIVWLFGYVSVRLRYGCVCTGTETETEA